MQHSALAELPPLVDILRDNPGWLDEAVDTQEASRITDTPAPSLETMRVRGGGPVFVKTKKRVHYTRRALFEWLQAGRRTSTSDAGPPKPEDDGADDVPSLAEPLTGDAVPPSAKSPAHAETVPRETRPAGA